MSILHMDLIFTEILSRLPVKSLMRFKCVSKSFKYEILSRNFSQLYLRYQSLSSDNQLLILLVENSILCYDLDFTSASITFKWKDFVRVVGSCNGLLFLVIYKYDNHFTVLNPTTQICQDIRLPSNDFPADNNIGFAFDPENLDYKIVSLSIEPNTLITKVYSLNADSWKILEFPFPNDTIDEIESGVLVNNNLLHWKFWTPSVGRYRIACFDVCKNEWIDDVLFPRHYYNLDDNNNLCYIVVINEKLCSSFKNKDESCFEVWMINEYGVQDSWVKLLSIHESNCLPYSGVIPSVAPPLACDRRSGRLLIRMKFSHKFLRCDSSGGGLTEVTLDGLEDLSMFPAFICKRSLVHLHDGHLYRVIS